MVKKKYRALRVIAFIVQVLAWVSLVLAILGVVGAIGAGAYLGQFSTATLEGLNINGANLSIGGILAGILGAVAVLLVGILIFILLLAASENIYVQLDIEQNMRQTNDYLRQLVQGQQPAPLTPYIPAAPEAYPPQPTQPTITMQTPPESK